MTSSLVMDSSAAQTAALDTLDYVKDKRAKRAKVMPHVQAQRANLSAKGQKTPSSNKASQQAIEAALNEIKDQFGNTKGAQTYNVPVSRATRRKLRKSGMAKALATYGTDGMDGVTTQNPGNLQAQQSSRRAANQKALQSLVAQYNGQDSLETSTTVPDNYRLLGQSSRLAANALPPQNTEEQLRNVASNVGPAGVVLPPPSKHIGTNAEYARLANKIANGVVAKAVSGAFGGVTDFNWGKFLTYIGIQQQIWKALFQMEEKELIMVQGELAIDGDKTNLEFQKVDNTMGRIDALQALLGNQQPSEAMANEMMKRLASSSSVLDETRLDLPNALTNQQHRGPVADQMLQNMIKRMASGKGLPVLPAKDGSAETRELERVHDVPDAEIEAAAHENDVERMKWDDKALNDRVLTELFPGGPSVTRTVLTQDEIAGLSPANQARYREARKKNLNMRANDWYGRAQQIQHERMTLLSAARNARKEADKFDRANEPEKAAAARRYADAFEQKAEYFLDKRDAKLAAAQTPAERLEAERYDPDIGKILRALRLVERFIGGNEEACNKVHQQITFQSSINRDLNRRLNDPSMDMEIRNNNSAQTPAEKQAEAQKLNETEAQRTILRQSAINLAWRQIGLGDMRRRYLGQAPKGVFHSANLQDTYELGHARIRNLEKLLNEAKAKSDPESRQEKLALALSNAKTYLRHFETLVPEREMGAVRLHSAMLSAFRQGPEQKALFRARLVEALDGKPMAPRTPAENAALAQAEAKNNAHQPAHERVPTVDEMRQWMKNTPRSAVSRHLSEREEFRSKKRSEYAKQRNDAAAKNSIKHQAQEVQPLDETLEKMDEEARHHKDMADFVKDLGRTETFQGANWGKAVTNKLLSAFNMQGGGRSSANRAAKKGAEEKGTLPIFATHDAAAGKVSLADKGDGEPDTNMYDAEDVDFTNLDSAASHLQAKANAVNDVYGDLNLDNNHTGAYKNPTMKRLEAWDQNVRSIDFSNLAQQPGDDLNQSSQAVADMMNGIRGEVMQAFQEAVQNYDDMTTRLLQQAHAIPHPS